MITQGIKEILLYKDRDDAWRATVSFNFIDAMKPDGTASIDPRTFVTSAFGGEEISARAAVLREANAWITSWERFGKLGAEHDDFPTFLRTYKETRNWGSLRPLFELDQSTDPIAAQATLLDCIATAAREGDTMGTMVGHILLRLEGDMFPIVLCIGDGFPDG